MLNWGGSPDWYVVVASEGVVRTIELMAPTMFKRNRNYLERKVHHVHESLTFSPAEGWRKWGIEHLENHAEPIVHCDGARAAWRPVGDSPRSPTPLESHPVARAPGCRRSSGRVFESKRWLTARASGGDTRCTGSDFPAESRDRVARALRSFASSAVMMFVCPVARAIGECSTFRAYLTVSPTKLTRFANRMSSPSPARYERRAGPEQPKKDGKVPVILEEVRGSEGV